MKVLSKVRINPNHNYNCVNGELMLDVRELLDQHVEHGHVAAVIVLGRLEEVSHPQGSRVIRQ